MKAIKTISILSGFLTVPICHSAQNSLTPQCFGVEIDSLELANFAPQSDQTGLGTCYSHAAVGSIQAALFRRDGAAPKIPADYGAVATCLRDKPRNQVDGLLSKLEQEAFRASGERNYKIHHGGKFLNGGFVMDTVEDLIAEGAVPVDVPVEEFKKYFDEFLASIDSTIVAKSKEPRREEKDPELEKLSKLHHQNLVAANDFRFDDHRKKALIKKSEEAAIIRANPSATPDDLQRASVIDDEVTAWHKKQDELAANSYESGMKLLQKAVDLYPERKNAKNEVCDKHGKCFKEALSKAPRVDLSGLKAARSNFLQYDWNFTCSQRDNERVIHTLMSYLCSGISPSVGVNSAALKRRDKENSAWEEGRKGYAGHAIVGVGIERINGEPHFVFRDSYGEGSQGAVPFSKACHINEVGSAISHQPNAKKGEKISEEQALAHFSMNAAKTPGEEAAFKFFRQRQESGSILINKSTQKDSEGTPKTLQKPQH